MNSEWDSRFIELAGQIASWSRDPSTQCGAVIVRPDKTIASTGFNGFPKRCDDSPELYEDRDIKLSRVIHAELNAILFSRESLEGYTIYVSPIAPCDRCAAHIIQSGITRVVYPYHEVPERWVQSFANSNKLFEEAGVNQSIVI